MRKDLVDIITLALKHLNPGIVHIPTNAIMPKRIYEETRKILLVINEIDKKVVLSVKPSIDGVGKMHDQIRGVDGNWEKLLETIKLLRELEREFSHFHLELGTVVSNFNKDSLSEIEDFVHSLGVKGYRNEIAEQREEFLNLNDPITPSPDEYAELMKGFAYKIRNPKHLHENYSKLTESLRLTYYELATRIMLKNKQVIPCYAGISNVHMTPYGDLWPCCVLGYKKVLGNLRQADYDFWKVWHSREACDIRKYIRDRNCACPLANQAYSNIMLNFGSLIKSFFNYIRFILKNRK